MKSAKDFKTMADQFHAKDKMSQDDIDSKINQILKEVESEAKYGGYRSHFDIDSVFSYSTFNNKKQKKHGRAELKKKLTELGFKFTKNPFALIKYIYWN